MKLTDYTSISDERNQELFKVIALLKNEDEVRQFFLDLCTPAEIEAMADRWAVVSYIKEGLPYRTIAAKTAVSVTTIGRVARSIGFGSNGYNLMYERLKKAE